MDVIGRRYYGLGESNTSRPSGQQSPKAAHP
jgi:hypothetical protein